MLLHSSDFVKAIMKSLETLSHGLDASGNDSNNPAGS